MYAITVFPISFNRQFHYLIPEHLSTKIKPGCRVTVPFGKRNAVGYVVELSANSPVQETKSIIDIYDETLQLSAALLNLAKWINTYYLCTLGEAIAAILPVLIRTPKRVKPSLLPATPPAPQPVQNPDFVLSAEQTNAVQEIIPQIGVATNGITYLIHGVTASGKTEIYFRCIQSCIEKNLGTIYLVPEISLTPQFIHLIRERFGKENVAVWHSHISAGEKYRTYRGISDGTIRILLGARSAVFAPFPRLGLIVVDEEHEFTYKQDQKPYYHVREVAIKRAELEHSVVLLGSATPALESYYRAQNQQYKLIELKERIAQREFAPVYITDMSKTDEEKKTIAAHTTDKLNVPQQSFVFSPELITAMTECLAKKEQIILFLNRRGYSTYFICQNCKYLARCATCGVTLTYHRDKDILQCHYCRYEEPVPLTCPQCKSKRIRFGGVGTEKVESEVRRFFPYARIMRVDLDTTGHKDMYQKIYDAFKNHELDILIGTQIIAKGFDFPKVTLVGIINADTALYLPDFRATERTFQLVTQVAGRAGRMLPNSKVILQTYDPDNYVFQSAKNYDYATFYETEILTRQMLGYPPVTEMLRIVFRGDNTETVKRIAEEYAQATLTTQRIIGLTKEIKILGPVVCSYEHLYGKFRYQILIKGSNPAFRQFINNLNLDSTREKVHISYDIDPLDML